MSDDTSTSPNPTISIVYFFVVTTIYTALNYNAHKSYDEDSGNKGIVYFAIYILFVVVGEYFINVQLTTTLCGSPQYGTALITTVLPWGFMFGGLSLLLSLLPGWLSPFANTFGYGLALMAGLNDTMNDILEPNPTGKKDPKNEFMEQALAHIYADKSMLINEITPDNFDYFWKNMKGIFKTGVEENMNLKSKLYSFVQLKYVISEYIWYILAGLLVTSVSYNYIINSACGISAAEMKKRHKEYEDEQDALHQSKKTDTKRVYSQTD